MAKRRKKTAKYSASKGSSKSKSGLPTWVKPTLSMIFGGGVGLVAMALLPDAIAPYAPAMGVLASKFIGGGGWGKYLATAGVVGGVTFLSRRKTIQVSAGALAAAKKALTSGRTSPGSGSGDAAAAGRAILQKQGLSAVPAGR